MKSRNNKQQKTVDFLVGALSNDKSFKDLLEDDIFVDYFNTFLSLPIFAKKLFYRKNLRSFEVYPGAEKPGQYYVQENIFSWVNGERGPLFLKTDICNEFRLCKLLVEELRKQNIKDGCRLDFEKELGSVLAMQRFKAFLHESAGERVLVFWLAAERYRRQTVRECRRFVLREIQEKFIQQGSWLELPHCIKSRFKLDLNTNEAEAMAPSDMKSDTLLASQVLAFTSLVEYWVPKYMSHRDHRILNIRAKWKNAAHLNEKDLQLPVDGISDKTNIYDVYKDAKEKEMKSTSSKKSNTFTSSDSVEKELDLFSNQSISIEAFEERLKIDAHDITADRIKLCRSQASSDSYNSDMIITIDNDDDDDEEEEDEKEKATDDSSSHFKLPRLHNSVTLTSENKITPKPDSRSPKLSRESSNSHGAINTGNHLEILCGKFRDASLSRAAALTQTIRGSSLLDVNPSFAFPAAFIEHNKFELNEGDRELEYLSAALASDSFAGQPFCEYIRIINNDEAFANIRFWIAAQQFLSSLPQLDTLTRRRQSLALIHIYLLKDSPRKTSLSLEMMSKLCDLLPKDLGFTALTAACVNCAKALTPTWKEFLLLDESCFHAKVASRFSSSLVSKSSVERTTKKDHSHSKKKQREKLPPTRIWNALQLAIAISVPRTAKPLLEGYEEAEEPDPIRDYQGSLQSRQLRVLNRQAIKALEHYRNCNPYQSGMAYYCYHQNLLLSTMGNNGNKGDLTMVTTEVPTKHYRESKPRLPKPRVFQEILHDPIQFDAFKKFLMKHDGELPLIFWTAVESMRTNTREAKQRQSRANGILRRFFGASTNQGKDLACDADIIKELPYMDKVTSAMLVSAQTCVARSMEEKWLVAYLSTFPEEDELPGITKLPHFRPLQSTGAEPGRAMKHKIRLLWRAFTRNIISFRRGIANHKTLKHFQNFLKLQHIMNIKRSKEQGEEQPQRVLISSKLVYTDRLIHDLRFWSEVERYKEFADAVVLCAKLGNYTKDDELIVTKKAKAIVNCFIDSLVPPRIQINISTDAADNILGLVKNSIIERSLFHSSAISVFSILLHYWKKFCYHRLLPVTILPRCPESAKSDRSNQIAVRKDAIRKNFMRRVSIQPDEEYTKIMFSLQNGIRIAVVPLERDIPCVDHKLPKINPFKLSKIARSFNIN